MEELVKNNIPHSEDASLINTLGDPVEIRSWQASFKKTQTKQYLRKKGPPVKTKTVSSPFTRIPWTKGQAPTPSRWIMAE